MIKRSKLLTLFVMVFWSTSWGQGHGNHGGRYHEEDWPGGLEIIDTSGVAIADSANRHLMYYLDINSDDIADFHLGFGPWWYVPESGAVRPAEGDSISILGGLIQDMEPPVLVVFEINGLVWRDSTDDPPWSGGWVHHDGNDSSYIHCPTDSMAYMGLPPGIMMGMGWPDSIYCQFEEFDPETMPGLHDSTHFAGYLCSFINPAGNHMGGGMGMGGMMGFSQNIVLRFHYDQDMLDQAGLYEESISVWYLDEIDEWIQSTITSIDYEANTVTVSASQVAQFYYLQAQSPTSINSLESAVLPKIMKIDSAFPNPFNPSVSIRFTLPEASNVVLNVYNVKGEIISNLDLGQLGDGNHSTVWNPMQSSGSEIASGVYLIEIQAGNATSVQKITYQK